MDANSLRTWRHGMGWTQARAADELAVSIGLFRSMEQGTRGVAVRTQRMIELINALASIGAEIPPSIAKEN